MDHGIVSSALRDVLSIGVDLSHARGGIDQETIWAIANIISIRKMASPHIKMDITFPSMIRSISIGELPEKRARILCKRVKNELVDGIAKNL